MITLLKRDLWSIQGLLRKIIFSLFIVWTLLFIATHYFFSDPGGMFVFPVIISVFISYDLVSRLCRKEEENGVDERLLQFPVSSIRIVLSRYLISAMIIFSVIIINLILFLIMFYTLGGSGEGLVGLSVYFLLLVHALVFVTSIFLFFYYIRNYNTAIWAGRAAVAFWIFYVLFLPQLYLERVYGTMSIPNSFMIDFFAPVLFWQGLLLFIISSGASIFGFRKVRKKQDLFFQTTSLLVIAAVLFAGSFWIAEERTITEVRQQLANIKVEGVEVEAIDMQAHTEEPLYLTYINVYLSGMEFWMRENMIITIHRLNEDLSFDYVNGKSFRMNETYFSVYNDGFKQEEVMVYQAETPDYLTEEELELFREQFDEDDFRFTLKSNILAEEVIDLKWKE